MISYSFSSKSKSNMEGVHPNLIKVAELALTFSKYDFGIPSLGGVRTAEQQLSLYNKGKSKLDGYNKLSNHQRGHALDVFAWVDGEVSYDPLHLTHIAACFFKAAQLCNVHIAWGGFWTTFVDMPHFEIIQDERETENTTNA